jgi:hypothetical protein
MELIAQENQQLYLKIINNHDDGRETIDVTPLSHPLNIVSYFKEGQREISVLHTPNKAEEVEWENDDNTLRDLLSPLQINQDFDF